MHSFILFCFLVTELVVTYTSDFLYFLLMQMFQRYCEWCSSYASDTALRYGSTNIFQRVLHGFF